MTSHWSLRRRLIFGALGWTGALLIVVGVASFVTPGGRLGITLFAHVALLTFVGMLAVSAAIAQLRLGLSPFKKLQTRLRAVREGNEPTVTGTYPMEIQPLVDEVNALLAQREQAVERAQAKAADLAHGLKTPLAVIAQESARASAAGHGDFASVVEHEVARMRRQVDYHLAQARAAASGAALGARSVVRDSVDGLVRTLGRLHADRGLQIQVDIEPNVIVRSQREDLDEMLGNLLDNACKWARTRVVIGAERTDGDITIRIDDDGPGLDPSRRTAVLERGVRADEVASGSGIGLAIVRDLAELYQGSITLSASPLGGLRVALRLP